MPGEAGAIRTLAVVAFFPAVVPVAQLPLSQSSGFVNRDPTQRSARRALEKPLKGCERNGNKIKNSPGCSQPIPLADSVTDNRSVTFRHFYNTTIKFKNPVILSRRINYGPRDRRANHTITGTLTIDKNVNNYSCDGLTGK